MNEKKKLTDEEMLRYIIRNSRFLSAQDAADIKIASGRTVKCWVCKGKGTDGVLPCQVCNGEGKRSRVYADVHIETLYKMVKGLVDSEGE